MTLSLFTDFQNMSVFRPDPRHEAELHAMLDQVIAWAGALKTLRSAKASIAKPFLTAITQP